MPSTQAAVRAPDGLVLATRHWGAEPAGVEPWASVLLIHGLAEHSGRYEHVGAALAAAGLDVHAYDQRGFGVSGGERAWVGSWSEVYADLRSRLEALRAAAGETPVALYGHSLGAVIVLGYVLRTSSEWPRPDFVVLSGPGIEDNLPGWRRGLARLLAGIAPHYRIDNGIRRDQLTTKPRSGFAYGEDPLVETRSTLRFAAEALAEQAAVREALGRVDTMPVPTLVFQGGHDALVPLSAGARFEGRGNVTRKVYAGLGHETHNEADSPVVDDIVAWLREQIGRSRA